MHKLFFLAFLVLFMTAGYASAAPEGLLDYNLSLAGYSLGMSYDEAAMIRPLQYLQNTDPQQEFADEIYFDAFAEHVFIDDIELNLWVRFKDKQIYKIIARFPPERLQEMRQRLYNTLGDGVNKTKVIISPDGNKVRQAVYYWDFPSAKLHLVRVSSNTEYATVGLVAKTHKTDWLFSTI